MTNKDEAKKSRIDQDYWKNMFENSFSSPKIWLEGFGVIQPLNKPKESKHFANYAFTLPNTLSKQLERTSRQLNIKLETLCLSGFSLLLHRMATSPELTYGIVT